MIKTRLVICSALLILAAAGAVAAQSPGPSPSPTPAPKECDVASSREMDIKPKISAKPDPEFTKRDRDRYHGKKITLRATLCGSGKVTDISVTQGLTAEMNSAAIAAARLIQFTPAEKDGKKVSRPVVLIYIVKD